MGPIPRKLPGLSSSGVSPLPHTCTRYSPAPTGLTPQARPCPAGSTPPRSIGYRPTCMLDLAQLGTVRLGPAEHTVKECLDTPPLDPAPDPEWGCPEGVAGRWGHRQAHARAGTSASVSVGVCRSGGRKPAGDTQRHEPKINLTHEQDFEENQIRDGLEPDFNENYYTRETSGHVPEQCVVIFAANRIGDPRTRISETEVQISPRSNNVVMAHLTSTRRCVS